ncbi:MAG: lactate utilization protein [Firmicutes bacterium]|nr:lactate utilization protein [Bacillota bacterium]
MAIKVDNLKKGGKVKIETIIKNLEKRNMKGYYAENREEALKMLLEMIPEGSSVGKGGSATLDEVGITKVLAEGNYEYLDAFATSDPEAANAVRRRIFSADYFITSTNAVTLDGKLMNIDGTGNRMAAFIWGPDKVIVVAGLNKIVGSEEDALGRIKCDACPPNGIRLGKKTPCSITGKCGECLSPGNTMCSHIVTTRFSSINDRIHVILVNESLGF